MRIITINKHKKKSSAPLPQQQQQLPEKSQSGPQKFQYKPALTYTVQQAGKDKAIVYHRNTNQPFIKALASPAGTPQPVCLVQPPNQPQQQPPQPQQQNPPNQPGVPPSQQKL
uniref:Uncharacterized protein n=1 Tax=Panagrolaimus superbus TaxID=310955 RepID=A0A914YSN5_9BILA